LHKIHTFVEDSDQQQRGNKMKMFFRQGEISEISALLKVQSWIATMLQVVSGILSP
jgi:hypothetical protein